MNKSVLDASAILAFIHRERGWESVKSAIDGGTMSSVNLCEVVTKLTLGGGTAGKIAEIVAELGLTVEPFDENRAVSAGLIVAKTRALGLSLADRACLALAFELGVSAITADRAWAALDLGIEVQVIR